MSEDSNDAGRGPDDVASDTGVELAPIFRNRSFVMLWSAQVVSSLGDWIGLFAILAIAGRLQAGNAAFAISLVTIARVAPGLVLAPVAGVLVDRWDRRRTMIVTDIGRGTVLALVPFISHIWQLIIVSLLLEILTLLWQPSKEALVPNLVPSEQLVNANSLGLLAAYGTFPIGALVFAGLAGLAQGLASLDLPVVSGVAHQESLAIWVDTATFLLSALLVVFVHVEAPARRIAVAASSAGRQRFGDTWRDLREGWQFIFSAPVVRIVMIGISVALLGGASVIPLGPLYAEQVLGGTSSTYGLVQFAMGMGAALGVGGVMLWTRSGTHSSLHMFTLTLLLCGGALIATGAVHVWWLGLICVAGFGMGAGAAYVTGFATLQSNVDDELRGRVFASLLLFMRVCILLALAIAPALAGVFDKIVTTVFPDHAVSVGLGLAYSVTGTQVVFWVGGAGTLLIGLWARKQYRAVHDEVDARATGHNEEGS